MSEVIKIGGITKLIKIGAALRVAGTKTGSGLQDEIREQVGFILSKLQDLSPVSSGKGGKVGGTFRSNWKLDRRYISNRNAITSIRVYNSTYYAPAIEEGSAPGNSPWASPGARTIESNGRVWSSQAIGGVTSQITAADITQMQTVLGRRVFADIDNIFGSIT